jgi:hypothetical protein
MSQLIVCRNQNGIVLAADSKALDFDAAGHVHEYTVERLVQLNETTAVLAGGAVAGAHMADALRRFVAEEKLTGVEDVYNAALPFLASEYERFMRKSCEFMPLDPGHHVHFIIAGRMENDPQNPFHLYFLWTKRKLPQLDGDEIGAAFAVPRLLRVEYRLSRMASENAPLDRVLSEVSLALERQTEAQEDVAGPFAYAVIDESGFRDLSE